MRTRSGLAALALLLPTVAAAQRTGVTPSFAVTEMYDGNLFVSSSDPQASVVHRFGPRVEIERRAARYSLQGRYEIDAEYLHALPDEGVQFARQLGSIRFRHRATRRLALEGDAAYADTRAPVELGPVTGFDQGRVRTRRLSVAPAVGYEIDRRTHGDAGYSLEHAFTADSTVDAHVVDAGLAHRFTRNDTGSFRLLFREFVFDGDATVPSQVALVGWTRRFARRTTASVQAGPRFRSVAPEGVEATVLGSQGVGRAMLEASYTRAEATSIGLPGSLETDSGTLSATLRVEPATLRTAATVARTRGAALQVDVLDTRAEATLRAHPWLSLGLAVSFTWQRLLDDTPATPGTPSTSGEVVFHDLVALTLVVAPPEPLEL